MTGGTLLPPRHGRGGTKGRDAFLAAGRQWHRIKALFGQKRSKEVAFVVGDALGHISRMRLVADQLLATCDCRITFFVAAKQRYTAEVLEGRFPTMVLEQDYRHDLDQHNFDLMVLDLSPTQWLKMFPKPAVRSAFVTQVYLTRPGGFETGQVRRFARIKDEQKQDLISKHVESLASAYDMYEADRVLLIDPVPLVERYAPLPAHYRACGAVFWSEEAELPPSLDDAQDVLLISMGSTGRRPVPAAMVNALVEAAGCRRVVVVGTEIGVIEGCTVPVQAFSRLAIRRLLPRTKLVVSSGGAGSTYLALEGGVPTIVWPSHRNQEILGEIIEAMGLGLLAVESEDIGRRLAESFDDLTTAARRFAPAASSRAGLKTVASELKAMLQ